MAQRRVFYGWIVVGAGVLVTCMGFGAMFSFTVVLEPISESMGWRLAMLVIGDRGLADVPPAARAAPSPAG